MPETTMDALEKLKAKRDKLNAQILKQEARFKSNQRKIDTRKKVLVGSYYLDKASEENNIDSIKSLMDKYLTRPSDRALFELEKVEAE